MAKMSWKVKFIIYIILSVPAFSGFPVNLVRVEILSGITYGWVGYWIAVNGMLLLVAGPGFLANALALAVLITMPVVFTGGVISYAIHVSGIGFPSGPAAFGSHYVSLCITMLTVIPLGLSLVAVVPFHQFEHRLLQGKSGVTRIQKCALMFLRVFNHIIYAVIPNIIETIQEERQYRRWATGMSKGGGRGLGSLGIPTLRHKFSALIREMVQLGVEGICASIQFVPLWAVEISQLPDKPDGKGQKKGKGHRSSGP